MKSNETTKPQRAAFEAATSAVTEYEALPLGEPTAEIEERCMNQVLDLEDPARQALFPSSTKLKADYITLIHFFEEMMTRDQAPAAYAELHLDVLDTDPALAAFLRSRRFLDRVYWLGTCHAAAVAQPADMTGNAFIDRYQRLLATQLLDVEEFAAPAHLLAIEAPALRQRIEACRARHAAHRVAELARIEAEEQAATAAIHRQERDRRRAVEEYFLPRAGLRFIVGERVMSGMGIVHAVRGAAATDSVDGNLVKFTLVELEAAMRRAQAADAAAA